MSDCTFTFSWTNKISIEELRNKEKDSSWSIFGSLGANRTIPQDFFVSSDLCKYYFSYLQELYPNGLPESKSGKMFWVYFEVKYENGKDNYSISSKLV